MEHIHVSGIDLLKLTFGILIIVPLLRMLAISMKDTAFGQALAVGI